MQDSILHRLSGFYLSYHGDQAPTKGMYVLTNQLRQLLAETDEQPYIVGIFGPPGAGKSTLAEKLVSDINLNENLSAAYLPMDGFHFSNKVLGELGRVQRKGAPDTFDIEGFVSILQRIRSATSTVFAPTYSRQLHEPIAASIAIKKTVDVVVTEGNYLGISGGGWQQVRPLIDILIYLDAPKDVLRERLIERQIKGGKTPEEARAWFETTDYPNIESIEDSKNRADYFISDSQRLEPNDSIDFDAISEA